MLFLLHYWVDFAELNVNIIFNYFLFFPKHYLRFRLCSQDLMTKEMCPQTTLGLQTFFRKCPGM